jgi:protein-tyrosine phosphatase
MEDMYTSTDTPALFLALIGGACVYTGMAFVVLGWSTCRGESDVVCTRLRKNRHGVRSRTATLVLLPATWLLATWQRASELAAGSPPRHTRVACLPAVWVGRRLDTVLDLPPDVDVVLDLTSESTDGVDVCHNTDGLLYICVPSLQGRLGNLPMLTHTLRVLARASAPLKPGALSVYVHCCSGDCRAAAVAALLLHAQNRYSSWRAAYKHIRRQRPSVFLTPQVVRACDATAALLKKPAALPTL